MLRLITSHIRIIASKVKDLEENISKITKEMQDKYNTKIVNDTSPRSVKALYEALKKLPEQLVRDCKITSMGFEDLGPSKKFYPNHGKYSRGVLTLNERILDDTKMEVAPDGKEMTKFEQTYYHELGHGFDEKKKSEEKWLSLKDDWLELSGWSESPKPGFKRLIVREKGAPELKGEWYFSPEAKFPRFYGKRNPWDDFADSFSYYIGGLKSFLPENKRKYFDELLKEYYE
jgi:hypothetical protein